jgi:hypothetical protein
MIKVLIYKFSRTVLTIMLISSSFISISSQGYQSNNSSFAQSSLTTSTETEQYTGELVKKYDNKLFITKDNLVNEYVIKTNIKIKRDGANSDIDKLQAGDMLLVTQNKASKDLLSLSVLSKGVVNISIVVFTAFIALLSVLGIFLVVLKGYQKSMIRTNSNPIN